MKENDVGAADNCPDPPTRQIECNIHLFHRVNLPVPTLTQRIKSVKTFCLDEGYYFDKY